MVLVALFTLVTALSYTPANAAVKKTTAAAKPVVVPQVKFVDQPQTEYTAGDMVRFNLHAPNYGGKVQYRVILWNDETKSYKDLWTEGDRYYKNWKPAGETLFNLHWIISEPGHYRITILAKRADLPNNKTALKGQNCDSYMAGVAFVVKPKVVAPTGPVVLDKEGGVYGSTDANNPVNVKNDVKIVAKNISYNNVNVEGNVYISADNVTLNNVKVKGTVFVDPGQNGTTNLYKVVADEIKVLSGGENSIHLKDTEAKVLTVNTKGKVRVESTGTTKIGNTVVTSYTILDSKSGTFGTVTIVKGENGSYEVILSGTFNEPVIVNTEAKITLTDGTYVKEVQANANAEIVMGNGAKIGTLKITKGAKVQTQGGTVEETKDENENQGTIPGGSSPSVVITSTLTNLSLEEGQTKDVSVTTKQSGTAIEATSDKTSVATVSVADHTVKVTAVAAGEATVTVKAKKSGYNSDKETFKVTVSPVTKPVITEITNADGASIDGNDITLPINSITKTTGLKVSKDSKLSLSMNGLGTFGDFELKAGIENNVLNVPFPTIDVNQLSDINVTNLFDAIKTAKPETKQALFDAINFTAFFNILKNADTDTKMDVIYAVNMTNILNAIKDADQATKDAFYSNLTDILKMAVNEDNKLDIITAIYSKELLNVLPDDQESIILDVLSGDASIKDVDFTKIFNAIQAQSKETQQAIFSNIDFTTIFNEMAKLDASTKNDIFNTINFTSIFNAIKNADEATKLTAYQDVIKVIDIVKSDSKITRVDVLNAINFSNVDRADLYDVLNNIDNETSLLLGWTYSH